MLLALALLSLWACSPGNPDIHDSGPEEPWTWDCESDGDGSIAPSELPWATGVSVLYRANAAGHTATVAPDGVEQGGVSTWDFTASPGQLEVDFDLLDPAGFTIEKALRLRVDVSQTFAVISGENPVESVRFLYQKECLGELARITSLPGETGATFGEASEFRVLDVAR